jgi:hypothetical protein
VFDVLAVIEVLAIAQVGATPIQQLNDEAVRAGIAVEQFP